MSKKSERLNITISWPSLLQELPTTAAYLKLFLTSYHYESANQQNMAAIWQEVAPVIGTKGSIIAEGLKFTLGINTTPVLRPGLEQEAAQQKKAYSEKYRIEQEAIAAGQGVKSKRFTFNVTGEFPKGAKMDQSISDQITQLLPLQAQHLTFSTYKAFRKQFPKAAAALYRRHLLKILEPKLQTLHVAATAEIQAKYGEAFNLHTDIHGVMPVILSGYITPQTRVSCDSSAEGQRWADLIKQANDRINSMQKEFVASGKAVALRSHYITAQKLPKPKTATKTKVTKSANSEKVAA